MQEKQLTITEWLAIAIEQIEKRNLIGARQIYSGIVGSIPDHKKAKPGLLAVTDALDCDYFPILPVERLDEILENFNAGTITKCRLQLKELALHYPDSALIQSFLGIVEQNSNDMQATLTHFKQAHRLNPNEENTKNYANLLIEMKALPRASSVVDAFLTIHPDSLEILRLKAVILTDMQAFAEAEETLQKAVSLNDQNAGLWEQYGILRLQENNDEDAILFFEKCHALGLTSVSLFQNLAFAHAKCGNNKNALLYCEKAIQLDGNNPQIRHAYSMTLLKDEQFCLGWKEFEWRIVARDNVRFKHPSETKKWDGTTSLKGKTILVYYEQGLVDKIQFSRYIIELAKLDVKIYFCIQDVLKGLFDGIDFPATFVDQDDDSVAADYSISLMSLPFALLNYQVTPLPQTFILNGADDKTALDPMLLEDRDKPFIGLCWQGNPSNRNDVHRSLTLEELIPHLPSEATFFNLQISLTEQQEKRLAAHQIVNFSEGLSTLTGTAAICARLDGVIAVDTSLCHLAGSLGIPTFLLLSLASDWRWGKSTDRTVWYNNTKLFKQTSRGEWNAPLKTLKETLERDIISPFYAGADAGRFLGK